ILLKKGFHPKGPSLTGILVVQDIMAGLFHAQVPVKLKDLWAWGLMEIPIGQGDLPVVPRFLGQGQTGGQPIRAKTRANLSPKAQFETKTLPKKDSGLHKGGPQTFPVSTFQGSAYTLGDRLPEMGKEIFGPQAKVPAVAELFAGHQLEMGGPFPCVHPVPVKGGGLPVPGDGGSGDQAPMVAKKMLVGTVEI